MPGRKRNASAKKAPAKKAAKKSAKKTEAPVVEKLDADNFLNSLPPVTAYLSTGSTLLDLAIANRLPGGFAAGRIAQIYGWESTGKTAIASEALGSAQRKHGFGWLDDVEGTWDFGRAELFGVDTTKKKAWKYTASGSIEELFDENIASAIVKANDAEGPSAQVVDTLSALPSLAEIDADMDAQTMGMTRAKQVSLGFRKYGRMLCDVNLAVIFVDQSREKANVQFGERDTTSGGRALKFYATTRVRLTHEARLKNKHKKVIGVKLGFFVRKNKIAPPFREGSIRILFDYGIDNVGGNLEWLHENDPVQIKKTARTRPWVFGDLKGNGLNELTLMVEEAGLEFELEKEVERVWHIVHEPVVRKQRVRSN